MDVIKMLCKSKVFCAFILLAVTTTSLSHAEEECSGLLIPGMTEKIYCGEVSGQPGTIVTIAPNILNLFPEIQAAGIPQTIDLSSYELTKTGATWDELIAEWDRREQAQIQPTQQTLPTFQTTGFTNNTSWLFGQTPTLGTGTNVDIFSGLSPLTTALPTTTGTGFAWGAFPSLSSSGTQPTGGIYPWMSTYWTATPTGTETQTGSEPLYPWIGSSAQPVGGTGITY